jgi:hypothetical protein
VLLAAVGTPAAVLFAVGADVHPFAARDHATPTDEASPCCVQLVAAAPFGVPPSAAVEGSSTTSLVAQILPASRWRTAAVPAPPRPLPVGLAPERGLQVRTILVSRSISVVFPEIRQIGGVRPDALRWHPEGLALDVMIPNPGSAEGIALGNQIVNYVMKNADRFGIQDAIWRGTYYTPNGPQGSGNGHFDHVHITTTGGGYPAGDEVYLR